MAHPTYPAKLYDLGITREEVMWIHKMGKFWRYRHGFDVTTLQAIELNGFIIPKRYVCLRNRLVIHVSEEDRYESDRIPNVTLEVYIRRCCNGGV